MNVNQVNVSGEWLTHFENSGGASSPRYAETMSYFQRLADSTNDARFVAFGRSPQGRDINCLLVGRGTDFSPESVRSSGKAVVLIQNGIHAGEIEGKDAWMLLLREILVTKEQNRLLENLFLIVIPILNVDGHERVSPFNRPNQDGPLEMGWRTTSWNLNLNRDHMKADTPEARAWLRLWNTWIPDFLIDNHTTNGADYQYHITYDFAKHDDVAPALRDWMTQRVMPHVRTQMENRGFIVGPYVEMLGETLAEGILDEPCLPRLSTGYAAVQNRPCLLVETHSLKPFANRVLSTKAMNLAALEFCNTYHRELKDVNTRADRETILRHGTEKHALAIRFARSDTALSFQFKGLDSTMEESAVLGGPVVRYHDTPKELVVPLYADYDVKEAVVVPDAYLVPREFESIAEVLRVHGVEFSSLPEEMHLTVERYRCTEAVFASRPYEGRQRVSVETAQYTEEVALPKGTLVVPTGQRRLRLIVHLLEPRAPDSLVSWGFFNAFFERKEYAEAYVMEPIARKMLEEDAELRAEFDALLESDEEFRNDPAMRLDFFYRRSPYFDTAEGIYPIMRVFTTSQRNR